MEINRREMFTEGFWRLLRNFADDAGKDKLSASWLGSEARPTARPSRPFPGRRPPQAVNAGHPDGIKEE